MDSDKFKKIVDRIIFLKPSWFITADELSVTNQNIASAETIFGCSLPNEYLFFLLNYRAGYFGFTTIYSLNPASDWYLLDERRKQNFPDDFIPFSDDGVGGYYGFVKKGNYTDNQVYYLDSNDGTVTHTGKCFFEHVVDFAFKLSHFNIEVDNLLEH